jgi:C-terminal processing protease CtpA/Prc
MSAAEILLICLVWFALVAGCEPSDDQGTADDESPADDDTTPADDDDDDDNDNDDDNDDDNDNDNDNDNDDDTAEGPFYRDYLRYWQTMDENYAYFIEKNVDWDAVFAEYEALARTVDEVGRFQLLIARITASLRDSHTWSSLQAVPAGQLPYRVATGVCLQRIGTDVYVSRLNDAGEVAGLQLGDQVVALDDEPVDDVLARAAQWEGCSTAHCCDHWELPRVDRYSSGEDAVAYTVWRGGDTLTVEVERGGGGDGLCKPDALMRFQEDTHGTVLKAKPIDDDLGYIYLGTLSDGYLDTILAELDQALAAFADRDGLIFDARYNIGGSDLTAMAVLARFLDHLAWPVAFRYKNGPAHDEFTPWLPEPIPPGLDPTDMPVVFLINGGSISAADFFAAGASFVDTFTLLGTPSCGATGAPDHDTLPASATTYYFSQMQRKYLPTGEQIEGHGIAPDIVIEQDPADIVAGLDTQIEAAIEWLRQSAF